MSNLVYTDVYKLEIARAFRDRGRRHEKQRKRERETENVCTFIKHIAHRNTKESVHVCKCIQNNIFVFHFDSVYEIYRSEILECAVIWLRE